MLLFLLFCLLCASVSLSFHTGSVASSNRAIAWHLRQKFVDYFGVFYTR